MSDPRAAAGPRNTLTPRHTDLLTSWLGDWQVVRDYSWRLQDSTVLHVRAAGADHLVKASATSHHIPREIAAHRDVIDALGLPAPRLEFADQSAGVLVTDFLPGELLLGTPSQWDPDAFAQAGGILERLQVPGEVSHDYVPSVIARCDELLDGAVGLVDDESRSRLRERLRRIRPFPVRLHFTHGDYQPRNWLINEGRVAVIDFGRGAWRSWVSDLVRLRSKDFHEHPQLERAFLHGMQRTLDDADAVVLALETLREAIGTVVWSHSIGDDDFEAHGHRMIARLLDDER